MPVSERVHLIELGTARMVLDPKTTGGSHNDYGSISCCEGAGGGGVGVGLVETGAVEGGGNSLPPSGGGDMTQNDLYQRQPLLPLDSWAAKNGGVSGGGVGAGQGEGGGGGGGYSEEEEDEKSDGLKRGVNGVVRIDLPTPMRDEPRFPKEQFKTFVAFLICVVNFIITTLSLALVHEKVPDRNSYGPLPDTFLDNVPVMPWALDLSEVLIMLSTTVTYGVIIFHRHRWIVLRRVFLMLSILYLMRSITMYVTVLPMSSSTYYCSPKANITSISIIGKRVFQLISGFGLSINGKHTYCGDYIYSGHTVILVICYLIISEYSPKRCYLLHWASALTSFVGVILVLLARGHYTVDVLIAYYVTTTIFWIYHTLANHVQLKHPGLNNHLSRVWWYSLFQYFEANVGGPVPRQYDWPLPWPRRMLAKHPNRDS
ncbi:phosphatidylcholine:ceramide cholinephosphotransferase 2-like isoform X2 [Nilaparvata lugens]|uniref:phosphatidylcholine:ceramide cholinephosphotransferase 2-like isoform X2 n=1 Tax=Nilaparvata lugens TaxID=108931 RepID=UPI00193C90CA|nr:phosphatidylcholine:ceramide cholinephosphotransferase 2-like isoform X2 [Nilaparvata lugens]